MIAAQIALRLIAHRQAALTVTGGLRRSMMRAARDDLAVWAAWLQTHPDDLLAVLDLLLTEIAVDRQLHGLDVVEAPTPIAPPDPDVRLTGPAGVGPATLDRVGAMLATFADWTITVTLHDGETVTARPARAPLTPEQAPAEVTA